jgi:opacity protein-like surface antigen
MMKKCFSLALALGLAVLVSGATVVHAQDNDHGFYVRGDAGVNLATRLNSSLAPESVSMNPGVRGDLAIGYAIGLGRHFALAPEFELGAIYNSFGNGSVDGQNTSGGGDLVQVPFLVNAVLTYKFDSRWSIYGGFGLGAEYSDVSVSSGSPFLSLPGREGGLAWQLMAGIQYRLGPGELGLAYQNLGYGAIFYNSLYNNTIAASYTTHF